MEDYAAALSAFQESYDLNPGRTMVLYNIAVCQRELSDHVSAVRTLRRYLLEAGADMSEEWRAEVVRLIAELEPGLARLTVRTNVPGARVLIDGADVGAAPLPDAVELMPGDHVVEARAADLQPARHQVRLEAGMQEDLTLVLDPLPASTSSATPPMASTASLAPPLVVIPAAPAGLDMSRAQPADTAPDDSGVLSQWWFWAIVGSVAAAGAVTATVLLWPDERSAADWALTVP
jgi:hypothetical protein